MKRKKYSSMPKTESVIVMRTKPPSAKQALKIKSVKERKNIERHRRHFEATKDYLPLP